MDFCNLENNLPCTSTESFFIAFHLCSISIISVIHFQKMKSPQQMNKRQTLNISIKKYHLPKDRANQRTASKKWSESGICIMLTFIPINIIQTMTKKNFWIDIALFFFWNFLCLWIAVFILKSNRNKKWMLNFCFDPKLYFVLKQMMFHQKIIIDH